VHTALEDAPLYQTLSYVWGSPERPHPLTLSDGTLLHITETLQDLLPPIHAYITTGYLWVDQLCIDQKNTAERGHQVGIMGKVYSNCYSVIIWPDTFLELTIASLVFGWDTLDFQSDAFAASMDMKLDSTRQHIERVKNRSGMHYCIHYCLDKILTAQWFHRAWVFQEIVLAPRSTFVVPCYHRGIFSYGACTLSDLFSLSLTLIASENSLHSVAETVIGEMYRHWTARHEASAPPVAPLERTLWTLCPNASTSEPLDKLFAFFGLNSDPRIHLQPSYELNISENLTLLANSIINGTRRLDILELTGLSLYASVYSIISPSWAPDFCQQTNRTPFSSPRLHDQERTALEPKYAWKGSCDLTTLRAYGKIIDTVYCHSEEPTTPHHLDNDVEGWILEMYRRFSRYRFTSNYVSEQQNSEDLWQRILQALFLGGYCTPPGFEDAEIRDIARLLKCCEESASFYFPEVCSRYKSQTQAKERVLKFLDKTMNGRDLWMTRLGHLVVLPKLNRANIDVCILHGSRYPIAMARVHGSKYRVLGACYLEEWMDAWGNGKVDWKEDEAQAFDII
jgi:hypothetical protein